MTKVLILLAIYICLVFMAFEQRNQTTQMKIKNETLKKQTHQLIILNTNINNLK